MFDLFSYPVAPGFKEKGGTSEQAAKKVRGKASATRSAVLQHMEAQGYDGSIADACAKAIGKEKHDVRSRFSELLEQGALIKTSRTRQNDLGNTQTVYVHADFYKGW
jgi:hypothetical protein